MSASDRRSSILAIFCALSLPLISILIRPWVERPINDDWSYARTAQLLAQTGHIFYNGWSTAALGWQLVLGAIFIKLFGFSFSIVRVTTVLMAMLTTALFHRTLVRSGVNPWTSAIGTLTLVLSPLFLPLAFSFMSDVNGLFIILLCLYLCLRAISASSYRAALGWLLLASVSNTVGGTVRQISWLGVLVMVPSTLWLLRRRYPRLIAPLTVTLCASYLFIFLFLQWFSHQPYTIKEPLIPGHLSVSALPGLIVNLVFASLVFPFFLLPVLAMFVPSLAHIRRTLLLMAGVVLPVLFLVLLFRHHHLPALSSYLFPWLGDYVTPKGLIGGVPIMGSRPVFLNTSARLLLSFITLFAAFSFIVYLAGRRSTIPVFTRNTDSLGISWHDLAVMLGPFTIAYLSLLLPRAFFGGFFDRYLLPLIPIALIVLLRLSEQQLWPNPHLRSRALICSLAVLVLFAGFSICAMHDLFALVRAESVGTLELRNAGIPPSEIDGGFEFNGWTQLQKTGFVTDHRLFPTSKPRWNPPPSSPGCQTQLSYLFPSLDPQYALSFDPHLCLGSSTFPPVAYKTWLPYRTHFIYIVRAQPPRTTGQLPSTR